MDLSLAEDVRRLAFMMGLNQSELARRAGIGRSTLTRWMNGQGDLMGESLERVLRVVGIDLRRQVADQIIEILNRSQQTRFL